MPKSQNQKTLACIALSMMEGKTPKDYSKQAEKMMMSMSKEKLTEWCKGPVVKE